MHIPVLKQDSFKQTYKSHVYFIWTLNDAPGMLTEVHIFVHVWVGSRLTWTNRPWCLGIKVHLKRVSWPSSRSRALLLERRQAESHFHEPPQLIEVGGLVPRGRGGCRPSPHIPEVEHRRLVTRGWKPHSPRWLKSYQTGFLLATTVRKRGLT